MEEVLNVDMRVAVVLEKWKRFHGGRRFYTQGEFSWREKSLCTGMGGGREKSLCTMQL